MRPKQNVVTRILIFFALAFVWTKFCDDRLAVTVRASVTENYQNQAFDLLNPSARHLNVRESKSGPFLDGISEVKCECTADAMRVLTSTNNNRRVSSTAMNRESSRSHLIFILSIESRVPIRFKKVAPRSSLFNALFSFVNIFDMISIYFGIFSD